MQGTNLHGPDYPSRLKMVLNIKSDDFTLPIKISWQISQTSWALEMACDQGPGCLWPHLLSLIFHPMF